MLKEEVTEGSSTYDREAEAVNGSIAPKQTVALPLGTSTYEPEADTLTD